MGKRKQTKTGKQAEHLTCVKAVFLHKRGAEISVLNAYRRLTRQYY
jgi:hypothetical protein